MGVFVHPLCSYLHEFIYITWNNFSPTRSVITRQHFSPTSSVVNYITLQVATTLLVAGPTLTLWIPRQTPFVSTSLYLGLVQSLPVCSIGGCLVPIICLLVCNA